MSNTNATKHGLGEERACAGPWAEDVKARIKRKNKVLFRPDDPLLSPLAKALEASSRRAVVLWALTIAEETEAWLAERIPDDGRAKEALRLSWLWARGEVKMPVAKASILSCHGLAKETDDGVSIALCHAIGQACGCVHTPDHALGLPIYELTALVRERGVDACQAEVERRTAYYLDALERARVRASTDSGPWARFLERNDQKKGTPCRTKLISR